MKNTALVLTLALGALSALHAFAAESIPTPPPRYEIGGVVNSFDPGTSTIKISGKAYLITTSTKVWINNEAGEATLSQLAGLHIPEGSSVYYDLSDEGKLLGIVITPASPSNKTGAR
ncbi:MAG: hypothetical protein AB1717_04695 [Pseudomonadota bacterium]